MLEEKRGESSSILSDKVKAKADEFKYGEFTYMYYRFLDKFHVEPKTWGEIFEYLDYVTIDSAISKLIANFQTKE